MSSQYRKKKQRMFVWSSKNARLNSFCSSRNYNIASDKLKKKEENKKKKILNIQLNFVSETYFSISII